MNTKDWTAGTHNLTATFAGNLQLGGSITTEVTVTINKIYAVYDGSKFYAATADAPTVPTTTEIADKNTINSLYVMGASVPDSLMSNCTTLKTVICADAVTTIGIEAFSDCSALTSVEMPKVTTIGDSVFWSCASLTSLTLGATPPATVGADVFYGCPTGTLTIQGNPAYATEVLAAYKAVADGNTTDDLWWDWTLPTTIVATLSAGTLEVTTGNAAPTFGTDNAITLTATFDKATKIGRQGTSTINQVEFKDGTTSLKIVAATQNADGKWEATITTNTKDWAVGTHNLTAEYAGNHELGGSSTTNNVTVTVNGIYAVYDGSKFWRATQTAPSTATSEEITDKKTINNLYIMGASVPERLMYNWQNPYQNLKTVTCADTVTTIGNEAFYECTGLTSVKLPKATSIGEHAFNGCTSLTSVEMSSATTIGLDAFFGCTSLASVAMSSATTIGDRAFNGCTKLTSVALPEAITIGISAFEGCTGLTSVVLPKATKIGDDAFKDCTSLASVEMPSATSIGNYAFYGCTGLASVEIPKVTSIGDNVFECCTSLVSVAMLEVTSIGNYAFSSCTGLTSVAMPKVTTISASAFSGCTSLASVEMPSATSIGAYAFSSCTCLTSVAMPNVTSIGDHAFDGCTSLVSAVMPKVTTIGQYAFHNCANLTSVAMPEVTTIDRNAFYNCAKLGIVEMLSATTISNEAFKDCISLTSANLPKATTIGERAFYGCTSLASVAMPNVTSIGDYAFQNCTSLASVEMSNVTTIGNSTFNSCEKLVSVAIPKVTTIGDRAFVHGTKLESLTLGATPPTVGKLAFFLEEGVASTRNLTIQGNPAFKDTVLADYKAAADDNTTDNKWYSWILPNSLNGTGVSTSEGKLTAAGSVTVNYGTGNTITFTASFAKVGENKLRTLAENQISLLKGGVVAESKTATLTDGVYSATFTVQTKNFTVGTYNYTATFDGNRSLVGGTATETVTVTINKIDQAALSISGVPNKVTYGDSTFTLSTTGGSGTGDVTYAVTAGKDVVSVTSAGEITVLKAGTATITATKAGDGNYNATTATTTITVNAAVPTITWAAATQTVTYTSSEAVITAPTATGVTGGTTPNGTISYTYNKKPSTAVDSGLPTNAGTYVVTAHIAAEGNYTAADSTTMELTIEKSTPTLTIKTMNGKTYDGTAMANPTVENMTITGANYADVKFAYSKNSDMSSPLATAPKDAGTYYVQASVVAGDNTNAASSAAVNFTTTKASALSVSQEYPVIKTLAKDYSFDLSKLLPSISPTQEYGNVTYAVVSTSNTDSVLTAVPTNSDIANGKLTLKVANVNDKDKTATVEIQITTDNFTVTNAVITVKTVDKIPLTISNVTMVERVYNGSAYAYTGTPTFTSTTDNKAVTGVSFTKEYEGRNTTSYTKSATAPTNAGEYSLILTVGGASAETYVGTLTVPFAITKKEVTVKAKDKDILVGAEIPSLASPMQNTDYTVAGFIGTDTLSGTVSMSYTGTLDNTKHGSYPITISGGTVSDNYTVKYENGVLNISIDVSLITTAITAANNAKNGIAIYDTAASAVPNGTKFVTTAEMNTLNTAIQTATDAKAICTTLAEIQAAAKALDDAVANFKAAIKTGTYTAPVTPPVPDDGGTTGGGSTGGGGGVIITPPTPPEKDPTPPTKSEINAPATVDQNGNASITVTDKTVTDAIKKAQDEAKKNGTEKNGVSVELNVDTGKKKADSISTNLPKTVQDSLVENKVAEFKITSETADLTFDSKTLQEIQKQAGGDATINASKADVSKLSKEAQNEIGNRPVFNLTITGKDGKNISDFGGGSATVSIPYILQEDENPNNLQAYFIDAQGKLHVVASTYDPVTKCMVFVTSHFSTYGIGHKANAPKFNDIEKHWAKNDIEFVTARGLLSGMDKATFSPNAAMTRGAFVTALGRLAGVNVSGYKKSSFADIKATDYFMGYVEWASKNGIVKGTSATTFAPNAAISRQEMAVIMTNYAKAMNYTLPKTRTLVTFADNANIASWASEAVKSMQMAGVIMCKDGNRFDPTATATRAEVSAVLRRYMELIIDIGTAQGLDKNDSGRIVYYENGKPFTGIKIINGTTYFLGTNVIGTKKFMP